MMTTEPPGVIFVLVLPDRQVLLQRRGQNDEHFPGTWGFPGGSCEPNEDYLQAVIREAKEEFDANLNLEECQFLMSRKSGRNRVFVCPLASTKGLTSQEGSEMRWFSVDAVAAMSPGFQQADILPRLRKFLDEMW